MSCAFCNNARVDHTLNEDDDFASFSLGKSEKGLRLCIDSGGGRPVHLEVWRYFEDLQENRMVAFYYPNYCPNCGRNLQMDYPEFKKSTT